MGQTISTENQQDLGSKRPRVLHSELRAHNSAVPSIALSPLPRSDAFRRDKAASYRLPVRNPVTVQQDRSQIMTNESNVSGHIRLGSFNPGAVHRRELPHAKSGPKRLFPSNNSGNGRDLSQNQNASKANALVKNKPLPRKSHDVLSRKRSSSPLANQVQNRKRLHYSKPPSALGISTQLEQETETLFLIPAKSDEAIGDNRAKNEEQKINVVDFKQQSETVLRLRHYTSERACKRTQLNNDDSPFISSSVFFGSFQRDDPALGGNDNTELKGENIEAKPSLESFMTDMGLHHPRRPRPKTSVKTVPSMTPGALKSEGSTEKDDEEVEEENCVEEENIYDHDDENEDVELEPRHEYFVVYRRWTHEEGEVNAQQDVSAPFISRDDANASARIGLTRRPDGAYLRQLFRGTNPAVSWSTEGGLSAWKAIFDEGVITTHVQCVEIPLARRTPPEAAWIPREVYVVHCNTLRIEYPPHNSFDLQNTQPIGSEVATRPSKILTTLSRANITAANIFCGIRAEQLDGNDGVEEVRRGMLLSEVLRDVREMNKEGGLFDRIWTNGGVTTRVWVEGCEVNGPRN